MNTNTTVQIENRPQIGLIEQIYTDFLMQKQKKISVNQSYQSNLWSIFYFYGNIIINIKLTYLKLDSMQKYYLELSEEEAAGGSSHKFYAVVVDGCKVTITYGRIGTDGFASTQELATGKLKMKVESTGYKNWDVQFPKNLRKEGQLYLVESIVPAAQGDFYRVLGNIYVLNRG